MLEQVENTSETMRSIGNIQSDNKLHFLPELHININNGYDIGRSKTNSFTPDTAIDANILNGNIYNANPSGKIQNVYFESFLNYVKVLKSIDSRIDAMVGYS